MWRSCCRPRALSAPDAPVQPAARTCMAAPRASHLALLPLSPAGAMNSTGWAHARRRSTTDDIETIRATQLPQQRSKSRSNLSVLQQPALVQLLPTARQGSRTLL